MNGNCYFSEGINPTLTCNKNEGNRVAIPIGIIDDQGRTTKRCDVKDTAPTLRSQTHGNEPKVAIPVLTPDRANKRQNGRRFKEDGEEAFTLTSQDRHGVAVEVTGYNATLNSGGGMTNTALALNARDYKGLSGSSQMMTVAAMCLQSTKESLPKKEKSQTALGQEKTADSANITNKEH
jgi:DNA (cytosine-5)-methyltransferase 1